MTVPTWWEVLLLSLAAYRTWRLLALDDILDRWRVRLPASLDGWLFCAWCSGAWVALAWWAAWWAWPSTAAVAAPFAVSAAVGLLGRLDA